MNNLPLQPLEWSRTHSTRSALHIYFVRNDSESDGKHEVRYREVFGQPKPPATGFATIDEAKAWAWRHYNEKMQPYVKPMPTWIDVDDRLPEKNGGYLAVCKEYEGNEVFLACWHGDGWTGNECIDDAYQYYDSVTVTHWMPIPEFSTMQNNKGE